jgi:hypothetical protein
MHAGWLPAALFLGFFAGMGWPACAEEPPAKRFRIGIVAPAPVAFDTAWAAVEKELRARGYVEGKNLDIDFLCLATMQKPTRPPWPNWPGTTKMPSSSALPNPR